MIIGFGHALSSFYLCMQAFFQFRMQPGTDRDVCYLGGTIGSVWPALSLMIPCLCSMNKLSHQQATLLLGQIFISESVQR